MAGWTVLAATTFVTEQEVGAPLGTLFSVATLWSRAQNTVCLRLVAGNSQLPVTEEHVFHTDERGLPP